MLHFADCRGCYLSFDHPLYYRLHCSVFHEPHLSLTIRKYHCKICRLAVLGKENILQHALEDHSGKGAYQCQHCKKVNFALSPLSLERDGSASPGPAAFKNNSFSLQCFFQQNYLELHSNYGCSSERSNHMCDLCGKKFCQPQRLKIHMLRMHAEGES